MGASSAITINKPQAEIAAQLAQADPPLSDQDAQISYTPAPGGGAPRCGCCCPTALADWARRSRL